MTYVIHYLTLYCWSKFQKKVTLFGGLRPRKHPEAAKNLKFEWHLRTWELHKSKYVLTLTPLVLQKMRLSIRRRGGRREGTLKLLVKVSLKFERSFGDLLRINPQKMWPMWYGSLLIITSRATSSYSFSHSLLDTGIALQNYFCRLKKLVRLVLSIPISVI